MSAKKKPYKATFSARSRLWTIWCQRTNWPYPIAIKRELAAAWQEAASNPLHRVAFVAPVR